MAWSSVLSHSCSMFVHSTYRYIICVSVAYVQVNFRGSTGYGKSFLHAGDKQWGTGDMQNDLTDAVQWAVDQGIADAKKIAIYGGSYGAHIVDV